MKYAIAVIAILILATFAAPVVAQQGTVPPVIGEGVMGMRLYMPYVDGGAIPQRLPDSPLAPLRGMLVNLDIYGFRATYMTVIGPMPGNPFTAVCWYGQAHEIQVVPGFTAVHCDSYGGAERW